VPPFERAQHRAILSQPDWRSADPWRQFGRPRLFFGISAGNMDSMINHYTANKKVRNDDAYSPGGRIGLRPDRATLPYCQRAREAFPGTPVIAGGVEASRRRRCTTGATRQRSILLAAKATSLSPSACASKKPSRRPRSGRRRVHPRPPRRGLRSGLAVPAVRLVLPSFEEVTGRWAGFARREFVKVTQETNPLNA
jgi:hypothetical protein